ncbi:MAG: DUF1499 domain-containing protein [Deltaproteobacteria bacterium]|nr:DUF1499 domain-containing protein [Deltaproteobacteria bacterium]
MGRDDRVFFWISIAALVAAFLSALGAAASGLGSRAGLWGFRTGFLILRAASIGGLVSGAIAIAALIKVRGDRIAYLLSLVALVIGLTVFYIPWSWQRAARALPPIHDITTDPVDPPAFTSVLKLRDGAPNPTEYGGKDIAEQQRQAYPDITPVVLPLPFNKAFDRALDSAKRMGWEIVAADKEAGRIEATDTTFWYGFKDDVAVRLRNISEKETRVDVRSVSRVGKSDVGTNARRIREYTAMLEA